MEQRKRMLMEKDMHAQSTKKNMEMREEVRIKSIRDKRYEKDSIMIKTQSQKEWDVMLKKEEDLIKMEDKQENVKRIGKVTEFKKNQILGKIEYDNMKTQTVRQEKDKLMETRF